MEKKFTGFGKMIYGGDYNPEQWLDYPEILAQDVEAMKQAHINTVSLGIFSWAALEPEEGKFDFSWMEERINTLWENGIGVFLATPSGSKPKWMADKYPEILRVTENGERKFYGERHNHCYTSPIYREKVRIMNTKLAEHFGKHPAIRAWHISNEYGGECHCPLCQEAFRGWLKKKYRTIDQLNKAWYTAFWSHTYNNFDQIEAPSPRGENSLHGLNLDWKRFVTDQTVDFARAEIAALRVAGANQPVTTNLMYNYQGLNYHKFADILDFVSWDTYPSWHHGPEALTAMDNAMQHDIMRSILKQPYVLMESCPAATNWKGISKLNQPGMLRAASLQALAHGSESVMYFQFRQSRGSFEKFHGAVLDHYGKTDTRVFREVEEIGRDLEKLQCLSGTEVVAQAAVVYDWESRWAMENAAGPRNKNLYYKEAVEKSYYALRKYGLNVDVIDQTQELDAYNVLAIPMAYLFHDGFAEKVRAFVERGGILFLTYWSGIVDETDLCFLGGTPHGLLDVMGLRSEEIDGLYDGESNRALPVPGNELGLENFYTCEHLCEIVGLTTARSLMTYGENFYRGRAIAAVNDFGAGKAYYVGADLEQAFYDDFYARALRAAGIKGLLGQGTVPDGVEVTSRTGEKKNYLILQNFGQSTLKVDIPNHMTVILGKESGELSRFDTLILEGNK